jgi:hypothetical protein
VAAKPLFGPGATGWYRLALLAAPLLLGGIGYGAYAYYHSPWWTAEGFAPDQPVLFSHRHHAGELRIDCRFCHNGVERSSFAGLPSTQTCLVCHSQIFTDTAMLRPVIRSAERQTPLAWTRVNWVPDFVFFNHSLHLAKGVGCTTCHGPVGTYALEEQRAPFDMRWCLDCHRDPGPRLRPKSRLYDPTWVPAPDAARGRRLMAEYHVHSAHLTDCVTCHR